MAPHPTALVLAQHLAGMLPPDESADLARHLETCALCRGEVETLQAMKLGPLEGHDLEATHIRELGRTTSGEVIAAGTTIGRYVVIAELGRGAMGQVLAAMDPRLDRKVALKLLRADLPVVENKPLRARLEREAQALARLSHPNVVAVHDLGDYGEGLFIAMDLVEGQTLTQWLANGHTWQEAQQVFLMAGEGLAAAHRAGLVHRDFKPDNVLVGDDGIVRVSDFGVSRRVATESRGEDTITGAGSLIGTPAYMSPEQFDGKPADARSDQFSFCVALFEALSGQRPFDGASLRALSEAVHRGPPQRIPSRVTLPAWLEALVLKGLARRAADRFTSMDELLQALRGPAPKRRSRVVPVVVASVALLATGLLGWRELERRRADPCLHVAERAAAAWDDAALARMKAGVERAKVAWSTEAIALLDRQFRDFLANWSADATQACSELRSPDAAVRSATAARLACLEERLATFEKLRRVFEEPSATTMRVSLMRVATVLDGRGCSTAGAYFDLPEGGQHRAEFVEVRDALMSFELATSLATDQPTVEVVAALRHRATGLGLLQLAAAARVLEGRLLLLHSSAKEAVAAFEEAAVLAEGAKSDALVASARRRLVMVLADELDVKQARARVPALRAAYQRLGLDADRQRDCLDTEAHVLLREGKPAEALIKQRSALAYTSPLDASRCELLTSMASMEQRAGDPAAGLETSARSLECFRDFVGVEHPLYADGLNARASLLSRLGRDEEAEAAMREALVVFERSPDTRDSMLSTYNLGIALKRRHKLAEARPYLEKALAFSTARGDENWVAVMSTGLAELLQEVGELPKALSLAEQAVDVAEREYGQSQELSTALAVQGSILESMGRHAEAVRVLRRCLASINPAASPTLHQVSRYELARSLWHTRSTRREAVDLVRSVRAWFLEKGPNFKDSVDECDVWLKTHPP